MSYGFDWALSQRIHMPLERLFTVTPPEESVQNPRLSSLGGWSQA